MTAPPTWASIAAFTQAGRHDMSHHKIFALVLGLMLVFSTTAASARDDEAKARGEKLGRVLFKTSCSPEAQKQFERALAMLHSFFFPETIKTFSSIPETDPSCAIAYWGIAISQRPNPLVPPFSAEVLKRGLDAVEKGEAIGAKTQRERDWLAALKMFYKDYETVDQDTRTKNYEKAMEALVKKYPDDVEATIAANQRTIVASNEYAAKNNLDGIYPALPHSWDFMQYAYLQLGQEGKAKALAEEVGTVTKIFAPRYPTECGAAATQARYPLERQDWKGAAALQVLDIVKAPQARAVTHFARALGAARSGDVVAARVDIDTLKDLRNGLEKSNQAYWAGQTEIQVLAAQAWVAQGQNNREEALRLMRAAADLEDAALLGLVSALPAAAVADPTVEDKGAAVDPDFAAGRASIEAKNWSAAIRALSSAALRDTRNADIQNYLGYAYRHTGQLDLAFKHYERALQLNPRHRGAHEYAGEAYLMVNDLAKAEEHLGALQTICLIPCEEYEDLKKAIADYRRKAAK